MLSISHYLMAPLITSLSALTREEALQQLIHLLDTHGFLKERDVFFNAVLDREKLVSTSIGMGVAIPHAKLAAYDDFFIAIGILQEGVIWEEGQNTGPVRIVCLIGGPDDKQTQYLQILSKLTYALKDETRRKKMLQFQSAQDIISLFENL